MQKIVSMDVGGRTLSLETGRIARQADGAVFLRYGDSVILVTAVWNPKADPSRGYLPLSREEASLFFRLVVRRYEKASVIVTTAGRPSGTSTRKAARSSVSTRRSRLRWGR